MIAPDLKQRNGYPERQPATSLPPGAYGMPESNPLSSAVSGIRSAIAGSTGRYPFAVLIAAAAIAGVTTGWLVKRR